MAQTSLLDRRPRTQESVLGKRIRCDECDGQGEVLRDNPHRPWAAGRWEQCEDCGGWGDVPVEDEE